MQIPPPYVLQSKIHVILRHRVFITCLTKIKTSNIRNDVKQKHRLIRNNNNDRRCWINGVLTLNHRIRPSQYRNSLRRAIKEPKTF